MDLGNPNARSKILPIHLNTVEDRNSGNRHVHRLFCLSIFPVSDRAGYSQDQKQ